MVAGSARTRVQRHRRPRVTAAPARPAQDDKTLVGRFGAYSQAEPFPQLPGGGPATSRNLGRATRDRTVDATASKTRPRRIGGGTP